MTLQLLAEERIGTVRRLEMQMQLAAENAAFAQAVGALNGRAG